MAVLKSLDVSALITSVSKAGRGDVVSGDGLVLGDQDLRKVMGAARGSRIKGLNLVRCKITLGGAALVVRKCKDIGKEGVALNLANNDIQVDGDEAIAEFNDLLSALAGSQPYITRLVLSGNNLTELDVSLTRDLVATVRKERKITAGLDPSGVIFTPEGPSCMLEDLGISAAQTVPLDGIFDKAPLHDVVLLNTPPPTRTSTSPSSTPASTPTPSKCIIRGLTVRIKQNNIHTPPTKLRGDQVVILQKDAPYEIFLENKNGTGAYVCKISLNGIPFGYLYKLVPKSHHKVSSPGKVGGPLYLKNHMKNRWYPLEVKFFGATVQNGVWDYKLGEPDVVIETLLGCEVEETVPRYRQASLYMKSPVRRSNSYTHTSPVSTPPSPVYMTSPRTPRTTLRSKHSVSFNLEASPNKATRTHSQPLPVPVRPSLARTPKRAAPLLFTSPVPVTSNSLFKTKKPPPTLF